MWELLSLQIIFRFSPQEQLCRKATCLHLSSEVKNVLQHGILQLEADYMTHFPLPFSSVFLSKNRGEQSSPELIETVLAPICSKSVFLAPCMKPIISMRAPVLNWELFMTGRVSFPTSGLASLLPEVPSASFGPKSAPCHCCAGRFWHSSGLGSTTEAWEAWKIHFLCLLSLWKSEIHSL